MIDEAVFFHFEVPGVTEQHICVPQLGWMTAVGWQPQQCVKSHVWGATGLKPRSIVTSIGLAQVCVPL
jgi:hypothetical protein